MNTRIRPGLCKPLSQFVCISLISSLMFCTAAYAQSGGAVYTPSGAADTKPQADPEHEAALVRFVQAMNLYSGFKLAMAQMYADGNANDPDLQRFNNEVFPESWINQALVDIYRPILAKVSRKDLDASTKFLLSPVGKKFVEQAMHDSDAVKAAAPKWTPAEREAVMRFNLSNAGMALEQAGAGIGQGSSKKLGEQMGKTRVDALLATAKAKYDAMSDADFYAEATRLRNGATDIGVVDQLTIVGVYAERSMNPLKTAFSDVQPAMNHAMSLPPKDMTSKEGLASLRRDLQAVDDTYVRANEGLQMAAQDLQAFVPVLTLPSGLRRIMQNSLDGSLKKPAENMAKLAGTVQETTAATRVLLDFTESHAATITMDKDGKLQFGKQADLDSFRTLAGNIDTARNKLRDVAASMK